MQALSAFLIGLVFGLGLIISGMTDPSKVIGFLNILGPWNPSLLLVMAAALGVGFIGFQWALKRPRNLLGGAMHWPTRHDLSAPLIWGSLAFGAGWGLAGFCPGPAWVGMGMGEIKAGVFVLAMLAGMGIHHLLTQRTQPPSSKPSY